MVWPLSDRESRPIVGAHHGTSPAVFCPWGHLMRARSARVLAGLALAGAFAVMPAEMHHFAWAIEDTEIQVHGVGPWGITYVNPADDPRKK